MFVTPTVHGQGLNSPIIQVGWPAFSGHTNIETFEILKTQNVYYGHDVVCPCNRFWAFPTQVYQTKYFLSLPARSFAVRFRDQKSGSRETWEQEKNPRHKPFSLIWGKKRCGLRYPLSSLRFLGSNKTLTPGGVEEPSAWAKAGSPETPEKKTGGQLNLGSDD